MLKAQSVDKVDNEATFTQKCFLKVSSQQGNLMSNILEAVSSSSFMDCN